MMQHYDSKIDFANLNRIYLGLLLNYALSQIEKYQNSKVYVMNFAFQLSFIYLWAVTLNQMQKSLLCPMQCCLFLIIYHHKSTRLFYPLFFLKQSPVYSPQSALYHYYQFCYLNYPLTLLIVDHDCGNICSNVE